METTSPVPNLAVSQRESFITGQEHHQSPASRFSLLLWALTPTKESSPITPFRAHLLLSSIWFPKSGKGLVQDPKRQ